MNTSRPYTLITGASSGIGQALAEECAGRGLDLLLVALPEPALEQIAGELQEKYRVRVQVLGLDLLPAEAPSQLFRWCEEKDFPVDKLINNIGVGGRSDFETASLSELSAMLSLNIQAATLLSRLFVDKLKEHPRSYILNVGSAAGFFHIPHKAVYSASKAYLYSFSRALRSELKPQGIHVALLCPGGAENRRDPVVHRKINGWLGRNLHHSTGYIAHAAMHGLLNGQKVITPGLLPKLYVGLGRIFPSPLVDGAVRFIFKKEG